MRAFSKLVAFSVGLSGLAAVGRGDEDGGTGAERAKVRARIPPSG